MILKVGGVNLISENLIFKSRRRKIKGCGGKVVVLVKKSPESLKS